MATQISTPLVQSSASSFDWLDRIAASLSGRRQEAYPALKAVLTTLRDALPVESAVALSTRIPLLIRGVYFDGYQPARAPIKLTDVNAFVGEVDRRLHADASTSGASAPIDAAVAVDAVLSVVADHLDPATAGTIQKSLPAPMLSRGSRAAAMA